MRRWCVFPAPAAPLCVCRNWGVILNSVCLCARPLSLCIIAHRVNKFTCSGFVTVGQSAHGGCGVGGGGEFLFQSGREQPASQSAVLFHLHTLIQGSTSSSYFPFHIHGSDVTSLSITTHTLLCAAAAAAHTHKVLLLLIPCILDEH
jgi:hypothetical protein